MARVRLIGIILSMTALSMTALSIPSPRGLGAQTFPTDDPIIQQMWTLGLVESQTEELSQVLLDFIGPRLAGSPALDQAEKTLQDRLAGIKGGAGGAQEVLGGGPLPPGGRR